MVISYMSLLIGVDYRGREHGSTEPTEPLGEVERFELINGRALRADRRGGALRVNKRKSARADRRGGALRVDFIRRQKWQLHR